MPRLYRWDSIRGLIIAACNTYVYDLRFLVATQLLAKEATHQVETSMGYIGLQDTTKKGFPIYKITGNVLGLLLYGFIKEVE